MAYHPSRSFFRCMVVLLPLLLASVYGLIWKWQDWNHPTVPGEIIFKSAIRPPRSELFGQRRDTARWIKDAWYDVTGAEKNSKSGRYFELARSSNPIDISKAKEIRRLVDAWHERLLSRYPELAVPVRSVPDEQNGFLKWTEFIRKYPADVAGHRHLGLPTKLANSLKTGRTIDPLDAAVWVAANKALLEEIHTIALLPDRSSNGISLTGTEPLGVSLERECRHVLLAEALVLAGQGDADAALVSVRAARGLGEHLFGVEDAGGMGLAVRVSRHRGLDIRVLTEIIPALPPGKFDAVAWKDAVHPDLVPLSELIRATKGEWKQTSREFLLPWLLDPEEENLSNESGVILDSMAIAYMELIADYRSSRGMRSGPYPGEVDYPQVSIGGERMLKDLGGFPRMMQRLWLRSQVAAGMTQAAFAILQGKPLPNDPLTGNPYQWDPVTRKLSPPFGSAFKSDIKPIILPNPR